MNEAKLRVRDLSSNYYLNYGICSQCVIAAVAEVMEVELNELFAAAHFLGGGGCLTGEGTCGALAAGELVLSYFLGRKREEFEQGKFKERMLTGKQLVDKFHQKYGGISCNWFRKKIVGLEFDMWQVSNVNESKSKMKQECAEMTGTVAEWVIEILAEQGILEFNE